MSGDEVAFLSELNNVSSSLLVNDDGQGRPVDDDDDDDADITDVAVDVETIPHRNARRRQDRFSGC